MKLQGMAILYIIIIIPMLIVISLTLNSYKEQLNNNIKYNTDLTGAVNDAITAFELNSSSQDFSNVSDNFTSLVDASVNIFRRSIATRLNMTNADESLMNRYFPLALFTGYSGYYIYSPTYSPVVVRNPYTGQAAFSSDAVNKNTLDKNQGTYTPSETSQLDLQYTPVLLKHKNHSNTSNSVTVTTNKDLNNSTKHAKEEIDYSLKQIIPYTLELNKDNSNNILLNFTLDNYISFTGKVKGIAYNKSGYLLDHDAKVILKNGNNIIYNQNKITDSLKIGHLTSYDEYVDYYIENELTSGNNLVTLNIKENPNTEEANIIFNPVKYRRGLQAYQNSNRIQMTGEYAYQKQQLDAIKYYIKSSNFSNFVYKNLSDYTENDINDIELVREDKKYEKYFLKYNKKNTESIFIKDNNKRVSDYNSTFNEIKRKAIRNSVQYDLIIATINYNYLVSSSNFILNLPVITDTDWERIIENVSFTAFLQGLPVGGGKNYSNYAVATSTMNEFIVDPDTIFFASIKGFNQGDVKSFEEAKNDNDNLYYHKINCPDFLEYLEQNPVSNDGTGTGAIGFQMHEWTYDARWSREEARYFYDHKNYSHFNCIINRNVKTENLTIKQKSIINDNITSAVAAEKERSFKSNKIVDGGGYSIYNTGSGISPTQAIKSFEVATNNTSNRDRTFVITINGTGQLKKTIIQRNNVLAYPSLDNSNNKKFINDLLSVFNGKTWDSITNITITENYNDLSYIKIRYM